MLEGISLFTGIWIEERADQCMSGDTGTPLLYAIARHNFMVYF